MSSSRVGPAEVGIYNEPYGGAFGGAEFMTALLSETVSHSRSVDLVHHHENLTLRDLSEFSGQPLDNVTLRYVAPENPGVRASGNLWQTRQDSRNWHSELSAPYKDFVGLCHWMPPFCRAKNGVLIVLFPIYRKDLHWPWNDPPQSFGDIARRTRNAFYEWEWRQRLASYSHVVSISNFTRTWTKRYWGIDSTVVYPPVAFTQRAGEKRNSIVSVGRFATIGHGKKHAELIRAFGDLPELRDAGWSYDCMGAFSKSDANQAYFDSLLGLAREAGVTLRTNVTRDELAERYTEAKIFVHAAGLGDPEDRPELAEHFGIATVEAMAAGCVPIVVNKGGQPEIVEHGVSGLVWNSLAELKECIRLVASDDSLRRRLSAAARERACRFGTDRFVREMLPLIDSRPTSSVESPRKKIS